MFLIDFGKNKSLISYQNNSKNTKHKFSFFNNYFIFHHKHMKLRPIFQHRIITKDISSSYIEYPI